MKALVILSTLLNLVFASGVVGYYLWREDDARFFVDYNMLNSKNREVIKQAHKLIEEADIHSEKQFTNLLVNKNMEEKFQKWDTPEELQRLLVGAVRETNTLLEKREREREMSRERFRLLPQEFEDFKNQLLEQNTKQALKEKDFEERKKAFEDLQKNTALNLVIQEVDKAKKVDENLALRIQGRPVEHQIYILQNIKKDINRVTLFSLLPEEERAAIQARDTNVTSQLSPDLGR